MRKVFNDKSLSFSYSQASTRKPNCTGRHRANVLQPTASPCEMQLSLIVNGKAKLIVGDCVHQCHEGNIFIINSHCPYLFRNERTVDNEHMIPLFFSG